MNTTKKTNGRSNDTLMGRRKVLEMGASVTAAGLAAIVGGTFSSSMATANTKAKAGASTSPKAFVYNEMQISVPFKDAPWRDLNPLIRKQPGLLNKTWLSGVGTNTIGGFYEFDSIENALKYSNIFLPGEAKKFGTAQTSIVFDAAVVAEASIDIFSPHFGKKFDGQPGAFVYTEVQVGIPFEKAPWRKRNPIIKQQPGLMSKTWLAGRNTGTLGGFEVFDTLEHAKAYALVSFPKVAKRINAAYVTKIFDASVVAEASRQMGSPYFS